MAQRLALLYENLDDFSLQELENDMARAGLVLERPQCGGIWLLDYEGDQVRLTRSELERRLNESPDVSFQWWFEENHDVYCRIRVVGVVHCIEFGMEGCSPNELESIGKALRFRCLERSKHFVGLVFDPEGFSEDFDWDGFFISEKPLDWLSLGIAFPTVLALPRARLQRVQSLPSGLSREVEGEICFFSESQRRMDDGLGS